MYSGRAVVDGPIIRPGIRGGHYPQNTVAGLTARLPGSDRRFVALRHRYSTAFVRKRIAGPTVGLEQLDAQALSARVKELRVKLLRTGLADDDLVFQSFALVRETARRRLGTPHYDIQLLGGWMLVNGLLAEMATGEGKTLTATLAAATAALAGIPVHVITANEYLAQRDCQSMAPLYRALGLTVAVVTESMDFTARQNGYQSDVVYLTGKQVGFDYLRDQMLVDHGRGPVGRQFADQENRTRLLLRGLCFAIVDEADSILIDEASTPLIIARDIDDADRTQIYRQALALARQLQEKLHFTAPRNDGGPTLTEAGEQELAHLCRKHRGVWRGQRRRKHLVLTALQALHGFSRDRHYLVCEQGIVIIDPHTGRKFEDRSWPEGLQQMIECKEGCSISGQRETLASISYQRFFRRYLKLSGMSGTLADVRQELRQVYGLKARTVPPHRPCRRRRLSSRLFASDDDKWLAIIDRAQTLHQQGKPLLIGTCSIESSERISALLRQRGLRHTLLNARQDQQEAAIIAAAGQRGSITVATNMAGRGTDIELGDGVAALGGLHVLISEPNPSRRVDRQLEGRAGRQGDPGQAESFLCLEDDSVRRYWPTAVRKLWHIALLHAPWLEHRLGLVGRWPQRAAELAQRRARYRLLRSELKLKQMMAFSGQME